MRLIMISYTAVFNTSHILSMLELRGLSGRRIGVLERRAFDRSAAAKLHCSYGGICGAANLLDSDQ